MERWLSVNDYDCNGYQLDCHSVAAKTDRAYPVLSINTVRTDGTLLDYSGLRRSPARVPLSFYTAATADPA